MRRHVAIIRLRIFIHFYVFMDVTEEMKFKWTFVSSSKYYNKHSILNILHIVTYYMHCVHFYTFNFLVNA